MGVLFRFATVIVAGLSAAASLVAQDAVAGSAAKNAELMSKDADPSWDLRRCGRATYEVDKPLLNRTGSKARYDFELRFTKSELPAAANSGPAPGLFTATQEELGLKLEAVKAPVDVLVVDAVQRPSAN